MRDCPSGHFMKGAIVACGAELKIWMKIQGGGNCYTICFLHILREQQFVCLGGWIESGFKVEDRFRYCMLS